MLGAMDLDRLPPEVSTAVLMVAVHGPDELEPAREELRGRLAPSLRERWGLSADQIEATMQRLR